MSALPARPAEVVDLATSGVTALRTALNTGRLTERQRRALDALLGTLVDDQDVDDEPAIDRPAAVVVDNDTVIDRFLRAQQSRGCRPETLRIRRSQLQRLARDLAPTPLATATEEHLVAWYESLTGTPGTIASYTSAARTLFRWMSFKARPRLRSDDPAAILDRPHVPAGVPRPIASDKYELALACAVSDPEMYAWLGLMGCSGLRACEIAWLQVADVEPREDGSGLLHIVGKGGKRRTVPAGPQLMTVLHLFAGRRGAGPVFTRPSDGQAHTPRAVSAKVAAFLRELQIPATGHQLRHRWGTDYHALDPDLFRQAKLMGHGSVNTTQLYTAVDPAEAVRHVAALTRRRLDSTAKVVALGGAR